MNLYQVFRISKSLSMPAALNSHRESFFFWNLCRRFILCYKWGRSSQAMMPYIFFLLNSPLCRSLGLFLRLIKRNYLTERASNKASHRVQDKVMALELYPVALFLDHDVLHCNDLIQWRRTSYPWFCPIFVPLSCHVYKLINDAKKPPFIYTN